MIWYKTFFYVTCKYSLFIHVLYYCIIIIIIYLLTTNPIEIKAPPAHQKVKGANKDKTHFFVFFYSFWEHAEHECKKSKAKKIHPNFGPRQFVLGGPIKGTFKIKCGLFFLMNKISGPGWLIVPCLLHFWVNCIPCKDWPL